MMKTRHKTRTKRVGKMMGQNIVSLMDNDDSKEPSPVMGPEEWAERETGSEEFS